MEIKHNKYDIVVYVLSFLLVISLLIVSNFITSKVEGKIKYVVVTVDGKQQYKVNLNEDKEIFLTKDKYSSLLADMIIEIKDNKVRVKKEESPLHYCSIQGWVDSVAKPIVCLPNSVIVTIVGQEVPINDAEM